ncbi:MAG: creatininase family protein [Gemmatimonadales bacterium]
MSNPIRLGELRPHEAATILAGCPRLLIPVGTLTHRGRHLPLGYDTLVLERLTDELSAATGIARSPIIPVGVHSSREESCPGAASLSRKSLHRVMNELIESWETGAKVLDVTILTAHATDAHLEALSTIRTTGTVRLFDVMAVAAARHRELERDVRDLEAALLLHLHPELVDLRRISGANPPSGKVGREIYEATLHALVEELGRAG